MEKRVDANFQNALRWGFCGGFYRGVDDVGEIALTTSAGSAAPIPPSAPSANESASEYSETNVQVTGVDEADFVKNDGSYIYMLANGKFRIVDAWPPEQAEEIAAVEVEGTPKKLFVHEGRAFIYSSLEPIVSNGYSYYGSNRECTYGYDCEFTGDGHELKITVFDISEVTQPTLVREIRFLGSYLNSRRIGNAVYSAVIFPEPTIANLNYWPNDEWNNALCSGSENLPSFDRIEEVFETLKAKNRDIIQAVEVSDWLPAVKDVHYNNGVAQENANPLVACENFYQSTPKDGMNFLSLIATDANGEAPLQATTILGKPGAVYASTSALYIAAKHSRYTMLTPWWYFENDVEEASTIHKFSLTNNPPASQYDGSGVVKGRILNQFSMDEFKGFFRIATTSSRAPSPNAHSTLSILEPQDNELVVVGQIDNIAPTEDIRSARFIGDKGYIVTFKKTDPLFVFDLSEPHNPTIAGELKIPGFSTYMHRLDDNHLLTIGYDADDQGSFAWFQGIMLQIFDVSDMTNPMLSHKEIIGTRGSTSEAATNHLAFNYFGSKGLLAIPMTICDSGQNEEEQGGRYGDLMTFSGLLVYQVNAETGFDLVGGVPHIAPEMHNGDNLRGRMSRTSPAPPSILPSTSDKYGNFCNNWWTQSNSYVKRSIFMDDYVFSITEDTIKANHLSALGKDIAVVHFEEQPKCDAFHADLCPTEPDCQATNGNWDQELCRLPLYTPLRSSRSFKELCTATYEPDTGILDIPCIKVADTQYNATLSLTNAFPATQLALTSNEAVETKMVMRGCEVTYNSTEATLHVPCLHHQGTAESYWVDFTLLNQTPLTLELTDFGTK
jgi:hypothetical protein